MDRPGYRIAADIGGTFTDLALITDTGAVATRKMLSTPAEYSTAVIDGIKALMRSMSLPLEEVAEVLRGCTVATNAILERKGARTALVTTKGFRDLLELRRIRVPLSAARQTCEAEGLSPANVEAHIIHGLDPAAVRSIDFLGEIADLHER